MPIAPASSNLPIRMNSPLPGRAITSALPTRATRIICVASPKQVGSCSKSIPMQSNPSKLISSALAGSVKNATVARTGLFSA